MKYRDVMRLNLEDVVKQRGSSIWKVGGELESITPRQLYRIVQGESDVTVGRLEAIAEELGVDFVSLFAHRK